MLRPYLFYCQNDPLQNVELLETILGNIDSNQNYSEGKAGDLVQSVAMILAVVDGVEPASFADIFAAAVIGYIDTGLLQFFTEHVESMASEDQDELGIQLLFVAAALGGIQNLTPYSPEELTAHTNGEVKGFDPVTVALTLGYATVSGETAYEPVIMRILSRHPDHDAITGYEWTDAFLYSLTIHAGWRFFSTAQERDQHYLLQHYFYQAVMNRVPVQDWLRLSFPAGLPPMKINSVLQPLLASSEEVPLNVDLDDSKKFGEVIHDYISTISREAIPTLAQEKFLNQWYGTEEEGEKYREWLRSALSTVYRIQTNTLVQK